jgi:hypothetical protein
MPVVYTKTPCAVFLLNQQHRRSKRTGARLDDTLMQHLLYLCLYLIFLLWRVAVGLDVDRFNTLDQWYGMVKASLWW